MRYVEAELPLDLEYVDLWAVSDVHRGHRLFDLQAWQDLLERIASDPHAYMVLNGDLVEAALKSARHGDTYRSMPPGDERKTLQRELEPVKGKILCMTTGNHERRHKDADEFPTQLIAEHLGIEDRLEPGAVVLQVSFGTFRSEPGKRTSFLFYVSHGSGNGRRPGGKLNRLQELAWVCAPVDGYISGHTHSLSSYIDTRFVPDPRNKCVAEMPCAYVIAGSFVSYGDYAEDAGYAPNAVSMPVLRLHQRRQDEATKHMEVILPTRIRGLKGA